jgi:hypothetical protein
MILPPNDALTGYLGLGGVVNRLAITVLRCSGLRCASRAAYKALGFFADWSALLSFGLVAAGPGSGGLGAAQLITTTSKPNISSFDSAKTEPGQIAQVDFGYIGKLYDPAERRFRKAWVFVLVLGYSRHLFAKIAFDQKVETWIRLHMEAFAALGGVPAVLIPDNLKAAVIRAAFGVDSETALNRSYRELARHYDFKIDPTPPCDPKKRARSNRASNIQNARNDTIQPVCSVKTAVLTSTTPEMTRFSPFAVLK